MKRLLSAIIAVAALLTGAVTVTAPALATTETAQSADCWGMTCWSVPLAPAVAENLPNACFSNSNLPTEVNGCKFWSGNPSICVDGSAINGQYYPVASIAQMWNNQVATPTAFSLDYSDDCVADLYTPSKRMVISGHHGGSSGPCLVFTSTTRTQYQNFQRWTNGPGASINFDRADCAGSQFRRNHHVSAAIGYLIGLEVLASSGWSGRVMYNNPDVNQYPTSADAVTVREIYLGYWGN